MILSQQTGESLNETRRKAKELYLEHQRAKIIKRMENAPKSEIQAVVRHIDGFLPCQSHGGKNFWLKVRLRLERIIEKK